MRLSAALTAIGWILVALGAAMVLVLLVALGENETRAAWGFGAGAAVTVFVGVGLVMATRGHAQTLARRDALLLVSLVWVVPSIFAALPFYFSDATPHLIDALFEAFSGLTTTGATVLGGLDEQARAILLWRALLQWFGGYGTVILALTIMLRLGLAGTQFASSEASRTHRRSVEPTVRRAVPQIGTVYGVLTLACLGALMVAGMPPFDALCHALSIVSTGGFSTRDASLAAFDGAWIGPVAVVFMLAGAITITVHAAALGGQARAYVRDPECRNFLLLAVFVVGVAALMLNAPAGREGSLSGIFAALSLLTTSGYVIATPGGWPIAVALPFLVLMLIGGTAGSTAGGIKVLRLMLIAKFAGRELAAHVHPHIVHRQRYGSVPITPAAMLSAWTVLTLFIAALSLATVLFAASGLGLVRALSVAGAMLSNTGPGAAILIGAEWSYAALGVPAKMLAMTLMVLGRIEVMAFVALLNPHLWYR